MYYYIFEQPKSANALSAQKKIKNLLTFYGISGEISRVSPARSIEELTEIALAKQYSTIIAVGSDTLVNNIISYIQGRDCTLGIIPIGTSPTMNKIIGVNDIKDACVSLKERKVKIIDSAFMMPNQYFITEANISNSKPTLGTIYFEKCNARIRFTNISIYAPSLPCINNNHSQIYVNIENSQDGPGDIVKTWNWLLGKQIKNNLKTYLRTTHFVIDTPEPIPVIIDNKIVAKTPIEIKIKPQALKIITSRVKIVQKQS